MIQPLFCPNPLCACHIREKAASIPQFWRYSGTYTTLVSGVVHRFKCIHCGRGFSERTFSIDYYTKRNLDNQEVFRATVNAESVSSIAKHLDCSYGSIQNRQGRVGRNCIAFHARLLATHSLGENLCADGFESFDRSQFFPNAFNLLVGTKSQFLYGMTHVTLKRKGRMTKSQKKMCTYYDTLFRPKKGALTRSFARLLGRIPRLWNKERLPHLELSTDKHKTYPYAIQRVSTLKDAASTKAFIHQTYSSKLVRTILNPLFPVNYYDRELRKDIAAFRRESTCFTRNVSNGIFRFMHHLVWHNYFKEHRIVSTAMKPPVHAVVAGIEAQKIEQEKALLFVERAFLSHQKLDLEERMQWLRQHPTPLKKKEEYVQKYAMVGLNQGS